jgi:hypothetical protein
VKKRSPAASGNPLAFVSVDETVWNPPDYPQRYRLDPWEDISHVHGLRFVLDWSFWTAALWIPALAFSAARHQAANVAQPGLNLAPPRTALHQAYEPAGLHALVAVPPSP